MSRSQRNSLQLYVGESDRAERHATWLELFFDLVFVFAIAELAHFLHNELTWAGIGGFAALFVPVWWLWIDFSYYADQFELDKSSYRLTMLGMMFGMLVLALTVPEALHGSSSQFATIYAALRLIIIVLYIQAWRLVPQSRELAARYTISFSVAFILWLVSIFVPEPTRFLLWGIALLIEISNGPITYFTIRSVPTQKSHMDERFGLFVIIVLGEAIVAVARGVADIQWQWGETLTAICGFITAVSLWWLYFEQAEEEVINQALRGNKQALLLSYVYGYSHVFVFAGIVAAGVGIQLAIESAAAAASMAVEARAVLCGGLAVFLLGLSAIGWASPRSLPAQVLVVRLVAALVCAVLLWFGKFVSALVLMGLLATTLVSLARFESFLPEGVTKGF